MTVAVGSAMRTATSATTGTGERESHTSRPRLQDGRDEGGAGAEHDGEAARRRGRQDNNWKTPCPRPTAAPRLARAPRRGHARAAGGARG